MSGLSRQVDSKKAEKETELLLPSYLLIYLSTTRLLKEVCANNRQPIYPGTMPCNAQDARILSLPLASRSLKLFYFQKIDDSGHLFTSVSQP